MRTGLILIGVLLAGVGIFPLNVSAVLHNVSAVGTVLVFALVVFWVRANTVGEMAELPAELYVAYAVTSVM